MTLFGPVNPLELLRAGEPLLEGRLVHASKRFFASCSSKPEIPYPVEPGLYYGSVWRPTSRPVRRSEPPAWCATRWTCCAKIRGDQTGEAEAKKTDTDGGLARNLLVSFAECLRKKSGADDHQIRTYGGKPRINSQPLSGNSLNKCIAARRPARTTRCRRC